MDMPWADQKDALMAGYSVVNSVDGKVASTDAMWVVQTDALLVAHSDVS